MWGCRRPGVQSGEEPAMTRDRIHFLEIALKFPASEGAIERVGLVT